MTYFLGIDFGTSGARAIVIDQTEQIQHQAQIDYSINNVWSWQDGLFSLLESIPISLRQGLKSILIDGTSSTVLLCDAQGHPLDEPILYNDARGSAEISFLEEILPEPHLVKSATSSLVKLRWWSLQTIFSDALYFLHQADWLSFLLHGQLGITDYHNALKLGYDLETLSYPEWLLSLDIAPLLPQVVPPGTPISTVTPYIITKYGLASDCLVCSGTTDSLAAFLASGATGEGEAVTSLGSTLVLKLLSKHRVDVPQYGIYSHRLGDFWLTGGASNTGGRVLKHFFSLDELNSLSQQINPLQNSNLDYYPLLAKGERFPINDPNFLPRLSPRPDDPLLFLHGLLEGIGRIEARGYHLLQSLGSTPLTKVFTAGGGAHNLPWSRLRERLLRVPVVVSPQIEAAYGSAVLSKRACELG